MKRPFRKQLIVIPPKTLADLSTHIGTISGLIGLVLSILSFLDQNKTSPNGGTIDGFGISLIVIFSFITIVSITILSINRKRKQKLRVVTEFEKIPGINILSEEEIDSRIKKGGFTFDQQPCFNRFKENSTSEEFWLSSWLGGGKSDRSAGSKNIVHNIVVEENGTIWGKIPIVQTEFFNRTVPALKIKFEHYENDFWCAVIHGKKGKQSQEQWQNNCVDISMAKCLHFYAQHKEAFQYPSIPGLNTPKDSLLVYIRLEDSQRESSGAVILKIRGLWEKFEIPISKFLIEPKFYEDYHRYVKQYVLNPGKQFDFKAVMQIMIGCSEEMPNQSGTILIHDLKFL